jgi:hypothetical protein
MIARRISIGKDYGRGGPNRFRVLRTHGNLFHRPKTLSLRRRNRDPFIFNPLM